jgi:hypothetical protein
VALLSKENTFDSVDFEQLDQLWKKLDTNLKSTFKEFYGEFSKFIESDVGRRFLSDFAQMKNELSEEALEKTLNHFPGELLAVAESFISKKRALSDIVSQPKWESFMYAIINEPQLLRSILPDTAYFPNSLVSNKLTSDDFAQGRMELDVGGSHKYPMVVFADISYTGDEITMAKKLTAYDRVVHDAVCTLAVAGNQYFTPDMVYRAMNGLTETTFVSPQAVGAVTKSIDKLRQTFIKIDCTSQIKDRSEDTQIIYDGYLLALDGVTVKRAGVKGGVLKQGYQLLSLPVLYRYANGINQVISVPFELLDTKDTGNSTDEVIVIKNYLIKRIALMKNKNNSVKGNKIAYEAIFKELQIEESRLTPKKAFQIRNHAKSILELWKTRDHFIKGFDEYKEGNSFKGIEIYY